MRVIKFRAWSPYFEEMYPSDYDGDDAFLSYEFGNGFTLEILMPPGAYIEGGDVIEIDSRYKMDKNATFMQFTGKYDINGIEIYEGDILRNPIIGDLWIVEFKECAFYACLIGHDYETLLSPLDGFEIVGNVHENPEMIK